MGPLGNHPWQGRIAIAIDAIGGYLLHKVCAILLLSLIRDLVIDRHSDRVHVGTIKFSVTATDMQCKCIYIVSCYIVILNFYSELLYILKVSLLPAQHLGNPLSSCTLIPIT